MNFDINLVRKSLIDLSYGDTEFIVDLIDSLNDNFDEFIEKFPVAIKTNNETDARFIMHKMKMTFQSCLLDEMAANAQSCVNAVKSGEKADLNVLKEVVIACGVVKMTLNKIQSEFKVE